MNTTTIDWDALISERAALRADIDQATARVADIDNEIREHHTYGTTEYAGLRVTVSRNRRLDAERFRAAYPVDKHPDYWKIAVTPNTDVIKEHVAPADLDAYYTEGQPKIVVK